MYTYYTASALGISVMNAVKPYLTQMQITQFLVGIAVTVPTHFISGCLTPAGSIALVVLQV